MMFHRHKWEVTAVQLMYEAWFTPRDGTQVGPDSPATEVLRSCSQCGKLRTTTLSGHWTLEQVKGDKPHGN